MSSDGGSGSIGTTSGMPLPSRKVIYCELSASDVVESTSPATIVGQMSALLGWWAVRGPETYTRLRNCGSRWEVAPR